MGFLRWVALLLLPLAATAETQYARGVVFHDLNQNGVHDAGEPGIPGVLVSNGDEVVPADAMGKFVLPARENEALFVIKPSGWSLPPDKNGLPSFYYLHFPGGSPPLEEGGVLPTGPLPDQVKFPLIKSDEPDEFSMLLIADPQFGNAHQLDYYRRKIVEEVAARDDYALALVLGDIVADAQGLLPPYVEVMGQIKQPLFHVIGNHDVNKDAVEERAADDTFNRFFGPSTYAFEFGKTFVFVLNNVRYPVDEDLRGRSYIGGFREEVLRFVANTLRFVPEDRLIVLAKHIPLIPNEAGGRPTFRAEERRRLLELFHGRSSVVSLAGHTHTQRNVYYSEPGFWGEEDPLHLWIVGTASGSWWGGSPDEEGIPDATMRDGTPPGYGYLHISGTNYTTSYRVAGEPDGKPLRFTAPRHIVSGERDLPMTVNFFNGCERSTVEYRVLPGENWRPMTQVTTVDPYYAGRLWERDSSEELLPGTRLPPARETSHLWTVRVPRSLTPGTYTIEVRATDRWGNTVHDRREVTVHPVTYPYGRLSLPE